MLVIHNKPRGSGKTKEVIETLEQNKKAVCFVPHKTIKKCTYPVAVHSQVFIYNSYDMKRFLTNESYPKIIFDEIFQSQSEILETLIKYKGKVEIEVYGTFE